VVPNYVENFPPWSLQLLRVLEIQLNAQSNARLREGGATTVDL